ncbi:glycosyltransferase family 2 protein [Candidatus Methylobacter oryzae]|uniref:Glycosyltransferase family 2 protein n=1 Tax=Candidatus Methylobacter oryzae TaxID=2497749 RepID=A0ABY3CGI7_9GAMM|nr:glycosyltransferase family 2 protein [Candidatus Methylobacter oryzae]TRX01777.1 glycosyltransferase family 2 protein [Candidatus Methylobacter oryzae]
MENLGNKETNDTVSLAAIILTFNEETHIERCIQSVFQVTKRVFVVDSFSADRTVECARMLGVEIYQHTFKNHADQLAWALENLPVDTDWVMRVDADEVISAALAEEIRAELSLNCSATHGYLFYRLVCFQGKEIRYGGISHWVLRLWRNGSAKIESRWMDEHMVLEHGNTKHLNGDFFDDNLNNITWWTHKHNSYATREAIDLLNIKHKFLPVSSNNHDLTSQARYVRWLKENLYLHLPLGLRAFLFFCYRMIFRLGVLDGSSGFIFHFLQGFWYRFLVDVKIREVERRMRREKIDCVEAIQREFGVNPLL